MANYFNLEKISQLDSYSQSQMWFSVRQFGQTGEYSKEKGELLITKISESQRDIGQKSSRFAKKTKPFVDSHFQSEFQKEHDQILNKYVENNMELFIHSSQMKHETDNIHQQVRSINSNYTLQSFVEILEAEEQRCHYTGFVTNLEHVQKVHNFVMTILQQYDSAISLPLLRLSREIWRKYKALEDKDLNQKEIIILATSMTESLMSQAGTLFNMTKRIKRQTVDKLRKFVTFYTTTFLFIIFEFFVNPYYQLQVQLTVKEFEEFQFYLYNQFAYQQCDNSDQQEEGGSAEGRKRVKQDNGHK